MDLNTGTEHFLYSIWGDSLLLDGLSSACIFDSINSLNVSKASPAKIQLAKLMNSVVD